MALMLSGLYLRRRWSDDRLGSWQVPVVPQSPLLKYRPQILPCRRVWWRVADVVGLAFRHTSVLEMLLRLCLAPEEIGSCITPGGLA